MSVDEKYLMVLIIACVIMLCVGLIGVVIGYFKHGDIWQYWWGFVFTIEPIIVLALIWILYLLSKLQY